MTEGTRVHPIEAESYRILADRVDLSHLAPGPRVVIERVLHASADLEYATSMRIEPAAVQAGVSALRAGAPIIVDVEMVGAGITGAPTFCGLSLQDHLVPRRSDEPTRSAAGIRVAARRFPAGAVVVIGCAPTALIEVIDLAASGAFAPALVIGLPVGFVGAAEAKEAARHSGLVTITNTGEKGGSAVAAAATNALLRLASAPSDPSDPQRDR